MKIEDVLLLVAAGGVGYLIAKRKTATQAALVAPPATQPVIARTVDPVVILDTYDPYPYPVFYGGGWGRGGGRRRGHHGGHHHGGHH